jgi:hypothetical protein
VILTIVSGMKETALSGLSWFSLKLMSFKFVLFIL